MIYQGENCLGQKQIAGFYTRIAEKRFELGCQGPIFFLGDGVVERTQATGIRSLNLEGYKSTIRNRIKHRYEIYKLHTVHT